MKQKSKLDGPARIGQVFAILAALATVAPIPIAILVALSKNWSDGPLAGLTLQWFAQSWERLQENFLVSARLAIIALIVDTVIAVPAAYLIARHCFPGRALLRSLTHAPLAIPGIAIGIGLVLTFPWLKPGGHLMIAGHVLYTMPFLLGSLIPAMSSPSLVAQEQVAASLGASPWHRFLTVTLPSVQRALVSGMLMVLALSLGEFNVVSFLYTPMQQPLPIVLFDSFITGRVETAAASTVIFLGIVIPAVLALERLGGSKVTGA